MSDSFTSSQLQISTDVPISSTIFSEEQENRALAIALPVCVGAFFIFLAILAICLVHKKKCLQKPVGPPMSRGSVEGSSDNGDNNNNNDGEADNDQTHGISSDGKILQISGKPMVYNVPQGPSGLQQDTRAANPDGSVCIQRNQNVTESSTHIVIDCEESPISAVHGHRTREVAMETVAVAVAPPCGHRSEMQDTALDIPVEEQGDFQTYIAMYSFEAQNEDQMSLVPNDIVHVSEAEEHEGWLCGWKKDSSKMGWFPKSHVLEVKQHSPRTAGTELSYSLESDEDFDEDLRGYECRALYAFEGVGEDELSFKAGDLLVVHHGIMGTGWWYGQCGDKVGWFPSTYVKVIPAWNALSSASFDVDFNTTSVHDLEDAVEIIERKQVGIASTDIVPEGSNLSPSVNTPDNLSCLPKNPISKNVRKTNEEVCTPSNVKSKHLPIASGKPDISDRLGLSKIKKFGRRKTSTDETVTDGTVKDVIDVPSIASPGKDLPEKFAAVNRQKQVHAPGKKNPHRPCIPPPQAPSRASLLKPRAQKIEQTELCNKNQLSRDPDLTLSDTNARIPLKDAVTTSEEFNSNKTVGVPVKFTEDMKKTEDINIEENGHIDTLIPKPLQLNVDDKKRQWDITLETFDRILEGSADFNEDTVSLKQTIHIPSVPMVLNGSLEETQDHSYHSKPQVTQPTYDLQLTPAQVTNRNTIEGRPVDVALVNGDEVSQKPELGFLSFAPPGFNDSEETLSPKFLNYLSQVVSDDKTRFRPANNTGSPLPNQSSPRPPLLPKPSLSLASPKKDKEHDEKSNVHKEDENEGTLTFVIPKGRTNRLSSSSLLPDVVRGYITAAEYEHFEIPPPAVFSSEFGNMEENNRIVSFKSLDSPDYFSEMQAPRILSRTLNGPQGDDFRDDSSPFSHTREVPERVEVSGDVQTDTVVWKPWGHSEQKIARNSSAKDVETGLDSSRTRHDTSNPGFMFKLADGSVVFDESDVGLETAI